jgi:hypothetical protein
VECENVLQSIVFSHFRQAVSVDTGSDTLVHSKHEPLVDWWDEWVGGGLACLVS